MTENETINSTDLVSDSTTLYRVQFALLLTLQVPSVLCFLFIFFKLCFVRQHRLLIRRVNNHALLCLVLNDFLICTTELPFTMALLYRGIIPFTSTNICVFWFFYGSSTIAISLFLLSLISIERYLLVFNKTFFKRHILISHYLPLGFCIAYPILFYVGALYIYKCEEELNYQEWACGAGCYLNDPILGTYDWAVDLLLPAVIVLIMNSILFGRVAYQKYRLKQTRVLRKNKKLILQLLLYVCVYCSTWFPYTTFGIVLVFVPDNETIGYLYQYIFSYAVYLMPITSPFISLITLSDLIRRRATIVHPQISLNTLPLRTIASIIHRNN